MKHLGCSSENQTKLETVIEDHRSALFFASLIQILLPTLDAVKCMRYIIAGIYLKTYGMYNQDVLKDINFPFFLKVQVILSL